MAAPDHNWIKSSIITLQYQTQTGICMCCKGTLPLSNKIKYYDRITNGHSTKVFFMCSTCLLFRDNIEVHVYVYLVANIFTPTWNFQMLITFLLIIQFEKFKILQNQQNFFFMLISKLYFIFRFSKNGSVGTWKS